MKFELNLFSRSIIACILLLPFPQESMMAQSEAKVVGRILEIGQTDNRTMDHLDVLSNRFGGRLIGPMHMTMPPSGVRICSDSGDSKSGCRKPVKCR